MTRSQPPFKRTRVATWALSGLSPPAARTAVIGYVRPSSPDEAVRFLSLPCVVQVRLRLLTPITDQMPRHESAVAVGSLWVSRAPPGECLPTKRTSDS
jgi:hypothetical protein